MIEAERYWPEWVRESPYGARLRKAIIDLWSLTGWGRDEIEPIVKRAIELAIEWPYQPWEVIQAMYCVWLHDERKRPAELMEWAPEVLKLAAGTAGGFFMAARVLHSGNEWSLAP